MKNLSRLLRILYLEYKLKGVKRELDLVEERERVWSDRLDSTPRNAIAIGLRKHLMFSSHNLMEEEAEIHRDLISVYNKVIKSGKLAGDQLTRMKSGLSRSLSRCKEIKKRTSGELVHG